MKSTVKNQDKKLEVYRAEMQLVMKAVKLSQSKQADLIAKIIERSYARVRQDVKKWRRALVQAEHPQYPRRFEIYQLYEDLVLDNHLHNLMDNMRAGAVKSAQFKITDADGVENWELTDLFQQDWFFDFIDYSIQSILYGHSLMEFKQAERYYDVQLIPRMHVRPEFGDVLKYAGDAQGIVYRDTAYMWNCIEVGKPRDLGLLKKAAPIILAKKNAMVAWTEFAEVFGMPMRVGKTNSRNEKDIDKMEASLAKMGTAAYAVFNEGESIEFVETSRTDAFKVYQELINTCNKELSKLLVGATMTTDDGSSLSQSEVHERQSDMIREADKRFLRSIVNGKLIPMMIRHGYNLEGYTFEWAEQADMKALWERTNQALSHYIVPPEWIEDTFGIPVQEREPMNPNGDDEPEPDEKKSLI